MPSILGIDLGNYSVKVSVYDGNFGRYQLAGHYESSVTQSLDAPPSNEQLVETLRDLLEPINTSNSITIVAQPADATSIRRVSLPFTDRAQVEKTLPFEVESQIPFDLDEITIAHRILRTTEGRSEVITAIAPTQMIVDRLDGFRDLGLEPRHMIVDGDMLGFYGSTGVEAIIDFGHTRTLVSLTQEGRLIATRAIAEGGRSLTTALANAAGLTWEEAQKRKHNTSLIENQTATPTMVEDDSESSTAAGQGGDNTDTRVLLHALAPLLNSIRATLIAFEDQCGVAVDQVFVTGGGCQLKGLTRVLNDDLEVPVNFLDVERPALALSHALALKGSGMTRGRELDIRQGSLKVQADLAIIGSLLKVGLSAAVVLFFVGTAWFTYRFLEATAESQTLQDEIVTIVHEAFPETIATIYDAEMATTYVQTVSIDSMMRVDSLDRINSDAPPMLTVLKQLSEGMPLHSDARIDVTDLTITKATISIKAKTDGYEEATRIETSLQAIEVFENASKGDEQRNRDGSVKFTITIPLGETAVEEG